MRAQIERQQLPTTTMMWYGMTEYGVEENVPNHDAVSVVISVPTSESTSAFKIYVTMTA